MSLDTAPRTLHPVLVDGALDPRPSRWLWLVKWLLALPHYVILVALWVALLVLTVVAFFAIFVTGRYPRRIFDFNVDVLRWTWRVLFYSYGALATDRYPPFTLRSVPYPATLEVPYPERLSRSLALVKWWLLAIPHYLVLGAFHSRILTDTAEGVSRATLGLVELLVVFAGVALLVTGRYPRDIFELLLGLNRWSLRVAAYCALMRDEYPPFRLSS